MEALTGGNTIELVNISSAITVPSANAGTKIFQLKKKQGPDIVRAALIILVGNISSYFNTYGNLTSDQIIEISQILMDKYTHNSLEDFILCFKKAKSGCYGLVKNRIDGHIIMEWIQKYEEEKADFLQSEHNKFKLSGKSILSLPADKAEGLLNDMDARAEQEREEKADQIKKISQNANYAIREAKK